MLTEKRYDAILRMVDKNRAVTVQELTEQLGISESTARRDLTALDSMGKLNKVFGGATARSSTYTTRDLSMREKMQLRYKEKARIAKYAASLIKKDDFVYIDAGTTTQLIVDYLEQTQCVFVTNSLAHAQALSARGCRTIILGGELKRVTEALVGSGALETLRKYNFGLGFFGTNGVDAEHGFTTPDPEEAMIKKSAMERCARRYVLCDSSKFGQVSAVTFAAFGDAVIITDKKPDKGYSSYTNIKEVGGK